MARLLFTEESVHFIPHICASRKYTSTLFDRDTFWGYSSCLKVMHLVIINMQKFCSFSITVFIGSKSLKTPVLGAILQFEAIMYVYYI